MTHGSPYLSPIVCRARRSAVFFFPRGQCCNECISAMIFGPSRVMILYGSPSCAAAAAAAQFPWPSPDRRPPAVPRAPAQHKWEDSLRRPPGHALTRRTRALALLLCALSLPLCRALCAFSCAFGKPVFRFTFFDVISLSPFPLRFSPLLFCLGCLRCFFSPQ